MSESNVISSNANEIAADSQETIIHLTENGLEGFEVLCRICANRSDNLIPIYSEEGITNQLADKMNLYLPVKVVKTDILPLQCCYQCASAVVTWHEFVIACGEADRRLRAIQVEIEKQFAEQQSTITTENNSNEIVSSSETEKVYISESDGLIIQNAENLNPFRQDRIEQHYKTEQQQISNNKSGGQIKIEKTTVVVAKKRGRPKSTNKQLTATSSATTSALLLDQQQNISGTIKVETLSSGDFPTSTDGEWIKTELVLETDESNAFLNNTNAIQHNNKLQQRTATTTTMVTDDNCDDDFDPLDPDYSPDGDNKKYHACTLCGKIFHKLGELKKHKKSCSDNKRTTTTTTITSTDDSDLLQDDGGDDNNDNDDDDDDDDGAVDVDEDGGETLLKIETLAGSDEEYLIETKPTKVKREFRCDYCASIASRKEDLRKHVETEHPEHFESFNEKRNRRRSKLDQEAVNAAKVVVDSRTYYHCKECGKNLHSPYTYIWHNRIHTGERPFVCDLCGKQFRVSQGLVRHLRETHAGIKNFPCDLCGRMFATRRNVEEHRRIHTNERPYICDLCGKSFKQKASLFVHNRSHTDSFPFKCSYCNQGFRTRPPLLVHVTRHTGEKPYACDICGRCFRIKYELKRHRLIHSDDKPFSCTECGLCFRQKRYLRNHNKINHNRLTP